MIGRIWEILGNHFRKKTGSCKWTSSSAWSFYLNLILFPGRGRMWILVSRLILKIIQVIAE